MKNLELIDQRREVDALESSDDDVAVSMVTLGASDAFFLEQQQQQQQSAEASYQDPLEDTEDSVYHVILFASGRLICCRSFSPAARTILWQVDLNAVLEDPTPDWFHVHLFQPPSQSRVQSQAQAQQPEAAPSSLACFAHSGAIVTLPITKNTTITTNTSDEGNGLELVGEFEQGILAVSIWQEMVALVVTQDADEEDEEDEHLPSSNVAFTEKHVMLLTMTLDFEVLQEVVLQTLDSPEALARFENTANDNQSIVSLGWRPDGKWLAVAFPSTESTTTNSLRIYDPYNLQASPSIGRTEDASGKVLPGLQQPIHTAALCWANETCSWHLAMPQATGKSKRTMVLMEPNGLAHGGFPLAKQCQVHQWQFCHAAQYNLLAVHVTKKNTHEDVECVQIWHRSNYHWYLKQEVLCGSNISHIEWQDSVHSSAGGTLASATPSNAQTSGATAALSTNQELVVLTRDGSIQRIQFIWKEPATTTAMVIDGTQLLITPLHKALVPPPMAACTISMTESIRQVVPLTDQATNNHLPPGVSMTSLVLLSNHTLVLLGSQSAATSTPTDNPMIAKFTQPEILSHVDLRKALSEDPSVYSFHQLLVLKVEATDEFTIVFPCLALNARQKLLELQITFQTSDGVTNNALSIQCNGQVDLPGRVLDMTKWIEHSPSNSPDNESSLQSSSALLELMDGTLLEYSRDMDASSGSVDESGLEPMLEPCPWIAGLKSNDTGEHRIIGMSWQRRLYCGDMLLSDAITTFHVSDRFLVYATADASAGQLKFIALKQLWQLDPFMGASEENLAVISAEYEPRTVERGSRIVTCLKQDQKPMVVLQLPRGNLEGVSPRALVLPHVIHQLAIQGNYKGALVMARQQKVDLNLLVDWNPSEFIENGAHEMVKQVKNVDHLNLFISSLRNENVTQTRHILPQWLLDEFDLDKGEENATFDFSNKVNLVCQTLRNIIMEMDKQESLLLPLLSTYAKEEPPQLEAALSMIQQSALSVTTNSRKPPLFLERAQSSIQYLAFLATYELLFDTALGIYELDLARAVARNSQMDPKEYLPLLKRYRELPKFYARYEIDMRLKRYPAALKNLVQSAKDKEVGPETDDVASDGYTINNTHSDALSLVKQHKLHRLGLELFPKEEHRDILLDLGEHLLASGEAENALTIFLTVSQPEPREQILKASRKCHDWRTFFSYFVPSGPVAGLESTLSPSDSLIIREVVQEMVSSVASASLHNKRETLSDAARIMIDYCEDTAEAIDILIQGQLWSEAKRIAVKNDASLVQKCEEAAAAFAHVSIDDLSERASSFTSSMTRYGEVLILRKEAYARGEDLPPGDDEPDETGSLFSAASQASHLTGFSQTSASSTSTSASYSTVISVASNTSSFSLVGADQNLRHKSKYNEVGQKGRKKKKKGKKKSSRVLPGSEKEFEKVAENLGVLCLDSDTSVSVRECIIFLVRSNQFTLASQLYESYQDAFQKIRDAQEMQLHAEIEALRVQEETNRREGIREEPFLHPLQKKIAGLKCQELTSSVHKFFDLLPKSLGEDADY